MNNQMIAQNLRTGINKNTIAILRRLNRRYTVQSLSSELGLNRTVVRGLLNRLVSRGLVFRELSPKHRRGELGRFPHIYTLTPNGSKYVNWIKDCPIV